MERKSFISKFYTLIVIFSPVLNMYGISEKYHTFTFREVFIISFIPIATVYLILKKNAKININKNNFLIFCYILFSFLAMIINILMGDSSFILRLFRYVIMFLFVFCFSPDLFDAKYGFKVYRFLAIFASIFLLLQALLANFFEVPLFGYIKWMPLRSIDITKANMLLRFYSIFEEPGYFGMIISGYLLISLFSRKISIPVLLLISFASLVSTATTSIVLLFFVFFLYIFDVLIIPKKVKGHDNSRVLKIIAIGLALSITFILFTYTPQFKFIVERLGNGHSFDSRFDGYAESLKSFLNGNEIKILIGNSMSEYPIGGYAALLISFGLIGTLIYVLFICNIFKSSKKIGKYLIILFLFMNIANVEFFGNASTIIIFFAFIMKNDYDFDKKSDLEIKLNSTHNYSQKKKGNSDTQLSDKGE